MQIKQIIFFIAGMLFLICAVVGIFLPILPATPFLLLASFSFLKSSNRWYRWLHSHPVLGPRLARVQSGAGLTIKEKIGIYLAALIMIGPVILFTHSLHLRIFLGILLLIKAVFFLCMRTAR